MRVHPVAGNLFDYVISNLSGERFEILAKTLFTAEIGNDFVPLGGMHDGGADGFLELRIAEGKKPGTFLQFSTTEQKDSIKTKIRKTIKALRNAGRDPKHVIYATNQLLPQQDVLRENIFEEYQVLLTVKDAERLRQLVNSNYSANTAFLQFFAADITALKHSAENLRGSINQFVKDPTVFAFLDHELKDRFAKDHLHDRILDSLIYWSLRDTDPDTGKFMSRGEIAETIQSVFPTATSVLIPQLDTRLAELSKKDFREERIRHHKTENLFCLPFDMRTRLAERALEESHLQNDFLESIKKRLNEQTTEALSEGTERLGISLIFDSVHDYFVEQGLIMAAYLENKVESVMISDQIVERQVESALAKSPDNKANVSPALIESALRVLRGVFYTPTKLERQYLGYLSRTSLLFMTLQKAPKIVEYFNQMGGNFRLFVGSDILVKAMSEQQLDPDLRQVDMLLRVCLEMGATLVLTEPVIDEVFTHLHAVDLEYRNHYLPHEAYLSQQVVSECNRILIRAYYYGRSEGKRSSWEGFLNQFLDPAALRSKSEKGRIELRGLLVQRFHMEYLSKEELCSGVNQTEVNDLAKKLGEARTAKNPELSYNDALMVFAVYRQRKTHQEHAIYDGFGYRTWWLTKETQVLNHTAALVTREGGVPYIMRPEFLLNFIALAPKAAHVRKAFKELLPTTVGLQLGQHLKPETMHQLLSGTEEWASLPPERVSVMIEEKVNRLKHERMKEYVVNVPYRENGNRHNVTY